MTRKEAEKIIEGIVNLRKTAEDKYASSCVFLYRKLRNDGSLISAGERINYSGTIKRAVVDLWDTEENSPENAPNLWEDILYKDGYRIIPSVITAALAFSKGERGWWNDTLYESSINGNVYTPEQYPSGWIAVNQI